MIKKVMSVPSRNNWIRIRTELSSRSRDSMRLASHYWKHNISILPAIPDILIQHSQLDYSKENNNNCRKLIDGLLLFVHEKVETSLIDPSISSTPFQHQNIFDTSVLALSDTEKAECDAYLKDQLDGYTKTKT